MTDKQIINGVDVSGCGFLHPEYGDTDCHIALAFSEDYGCCSKCEQILDCYYKQLKRKEQECKLLKSALKNQNIVAIVEENDQLKAENEKLKEKFKKFFNIDNQECWDIAFLNNEKERYKQALDEIEEEVTELFLGVENHDRPYCERIFDIINKAKDGE